MRRGNPVAVVLILSVILFVLVVQYRSQPPDRRTTSISEIAADVTGGRVRKLVVEGDQVEVFYYFGIDEAIARKEPSKTLAEQLLELGVPQDRLSSEDLEIEVREPSYLISPYLSAALVGALVGLLLGVGLTYFTLKARSSPT